MKYGQIGRWSAFILALALGASLLVGRFMPKQVVVSRSITIAATPQAIYPLLADFRNGWTRWDASDDEDPGIAYAYSGAVTGVGAMQTWISKKRGNGQMTLVSADTLKGVAFDQVVGDGKDPFRMQGTLSMEPEGQGTRVTWTDHAETGSDPGKRLMAPLLTKMIAQSMEKSLAGIKTLAESAPLPVATP